MAATHRRLRRSLRRTAGAGAAAAVLALMAPPMATAYAPMQTKVFDGNDLRSGNWENGSMIAELIDQAQARYDASLLRPVEIDMAELAAAVAAPPSHTAGPVGPALPWPTATTPTVELRTPTVSAPPAAQRAIAVPLRTVNGLTPTPDGNLTSPTAPAKAERTVTKTFLTIEVVSGRIQLVADSPLDSLTVLLTDAAGVVLKPVRLTRTAPGAPLAAVLDVAAGTYTATVEGRDDLGPITLIVPATATISPKQATPL
ncbi:MAG: hypothetical protein ACR2H3_05945 [Acidimicrobiales bacterium]